VPLVVPLAVLTFFAAFIPIVGAVATGIVAVLVALVAEGVTDAVLVGLAVLAVQQIEGNVVAPVLVGRRLSLHPMVVILSVATGGIIWGVLGAAIAVPLVAVVSGLAAYLSASEPNEAASDSEGPAPATE
jgi:predicted PurR-regulated permease PerM